MSKSLLNTDKLHSKLVIHSKSCVQSFVFHEITEEEVTRYISTIKTHTSPGLDGRGEWGKLITLSLNL